MQLPIRVRRGARAETPDDRWAPDPKSRWQFYVDVVGACNLRCPSCPVGNSTAKMPHGYMSPSLLDEIVRKAVSECQRLQVSLFNWTEPFLHPRLAEMIRVDTRDLLRDVTPLEVTTDDAAGARRRALNRDVDAVTLNQDEIDDELEDDRDERRRRDRGTWARPNGRWSGF